MQQLYNILLHYLKIAGVSFSKATLKQLLYSHPDSNSLCAMVDVLNEINIENIALRTDINGLKANGFPAIFHTKEKGETFVVLKNINGEKVHYFKSDDGSVSEELNEFEAKWSGVALYVMHDNLPVRTKDEKTLQEESLLGLRSTLAVLAGLACMVIWYVSVHWSVMLGWYLLLSTLGLVVTILLTMHDFGESNRFLHKVCHLNRQTNCNAVLRSSAAKLFGWLSMSDIGLCYFIGGILTIMITSVTLFGDFAASYLFVLTLCTFPYTIFSLWYQAIRVKKWCPLCLAVIGVLWAEIILMFFHCSSLVFIPVSSIAVFTMLACFFVPVLIWSYLKPLWKEYVRIRDYEYRYLRLKRTPAVIYAMLMREPAQKMEFSSDEIHLGTIDAPVHVTVVMSLFCRPCSREWYVLSRWLTEYSNSLWLTVRFTGYLSQNTEIKEITDKLTEIYIQHGKEAVRRSLTDWFEFANIQKWKSKYCTVSILSYAISLKNAQWENMLPINYTPAVFVDDRILPSMYSVKDLEYLLKEL